MGNPSRFRVPPAEIRSQKSRPNEFSLSLRLLSIPLGQFFQVAKDASTEMGTSPRSICLAQLDGFGHVPPSTSLSSSIVTFIPRSIPVTVSPRKGTINLLFYTPRDYPQRHSDNVSSRYPVLANFHGGGYTIGKASDDARWATAVVEIVEAVVVSVEYRLAPQYPFPTAVEDGVDAILYILQNVEQLNIDVDRIGVSGFSSGGNMAFTVPLRLQSEICRRMERSNEGQLATYLPRSDVRLAVIM